MGLNKYGRQSLRKSSPAKTWVCSLFIIPNHQAAQEPELQNRGKRRYLQSCWLCWLPSTRKAGTDHSEFLQQLKVCFPLKKPPETCQLDQLSTYLPIVNSKSTRTLKAAIPPLLLRTCKTHICSTVRGSFNSHSKSRRPH